MEYIYEFIKSWSDTKGSVNSMDEIQASVDSRYANLKVDIKKIDFSYDGFWHYDEADGFIRNNNNSFFQLAGFQAVEDGKVIAEQPVIIQDEIGYLGIIAKKINGTLNFLMQAKIEPGNVNKIQISPTIQATKSNFTQKHGGRAPLYLEFFANAEKHHIVLDQIQSEQSSRFFKKRNRNILIMVEEDTEIPEYPSHMWMTLGQIKELMKTDNLVNMDTRTVLSCIPFAEGVLSEETKAEIYELFRDKALYQSIFGERDCNLFHTIYNQINNYKMYDDAVTRLVPLKELSSWEMTDKEIVCKEPYDFKVIYCNIEIEGREVKKWEQPLVEANGMAVLGTFTAVIDGVRKFMVCLKPEIGCFDKVELGPVVQLEPTNPRNDLNAIESLFLSKMEQKEGILKDVILSEEGGRFYHEQNRNVLIEIDEAEIGDLSEGFFWADYATLNYMIQFNNCMNIQLRNLLSLLDI